MASPPVRTTPNPALLIQAHTNEYQALYTRATYFITLSSSVWPLIILYLTFVALIWNLLPPKPWRAPVLTWTSGVVVQVILVVWVNLMLEMYRVILYIEKYLRPLVQDLVGTPGFWLYEPLLMLQRRASPFAAWWEFVVPGAMSIALLAAALIRILSHGWLMWDSVGLPCNMGVLVLLSLHSLAAVKTRRAWEAAEPRGIDSFLTPQPRN
jgi:hypothetical protein